LDRGRDGEAEPGAIFQNLFEERRVARVRVLFGFGGQASESDVAHWPNAMSRVARKVSAKSRKN